MSRNERAAAGLTLLGLCLGAFLLFPGWPDDWDGLGFLASVSRFDMASFAPHPPGYPVYVLLLKLASLVTASPIHAARLVAVLSLGVTYGMLVAALPRVPYARVAAAAAVVLTPLTFHSLSGVGSEAPALACASLCLAGVVSEAPWSGRRRMWMVGLGVGLGLGVRLSWAPLYVVFLLLGPSRTRLRGAVVATVTSVAWGVPLVVATGAQQLVLLYRTQASGHFTHWGGTAFTEPSRLRFLVRDFFEDGLGGGRDPLGIALLVCLGFALCFSRAALRRIDRRDVARALLLAGPYLVWVALGQNLREQPRHVLPLVFLFTFVVARAAVRLERTPRVAISLFLALATLRASADAVARAETPPPGAQLLLYLRGHASPADAAVFAGASSRFLTGTEWEPVTRPAGSLGDALLAVTHFNTLPRTLFLTSELTALDEAPLPLTSVALFCRPARLDRRTACLHLYALDGKAATMR